MNAQESEMSPEKFQKDSQKFQRIFERILKND